MKNKRKGFSVIEIVLVLGVIGILVGFLVPKTRNYLALAKDTKVVNTLSSIRTAAEMYTLEKGIYIENTGSENINLTKIDIDKLKNYLKIGSEFKTVGDETHLEIGGSKDTLESEEIKYGGAVKLKVNTDNEIVLEPLNGIGTYSIKGEKWIDL